MHEPTLVENRMYTQFIKNNDDPEVMASITISQRNERLTSTLRHDKKMGSEERLLERLSEAFLEKGEDINI